MNRVQVKDVVLLITDGRSQDYVAPPADRLQSLGAVVSIQKLYCCRQPATAAVKHCVRNRSMYFNNQTFFDFIQGRIFFGGSWAMLPFLLARMFLTAFFWVWGLWWRALPKSRIKIKLWYFLDNLATICWWILSKMIIKMLNVCQKSQNLPSGFSTWFPLIPTWFRWLEAPPPD